MYIKNIFNIIVLLIKDFNKYFYNIILSRKFSIISNKKKLFTLRKLGGHIGYRYRTFFSKEPETLEWIDNFESINNEITFFDVGANIGIYSLYAAQKHNNIKIFSFEPESLNYASLNLNIYDNKFQEKIKSFCVSINDNNTNLLSSIYLKRMRFGGSCNSFGRIVNSEGDKFDTSFEQGSCSLKLDDVFEQLKSSCNIDYVKIDVDGNELMVVKSMINSLKTKMIKSILIELNLSFHEHRTAYQMIEDCGYSVLKNKNTTEICNYIFHRKI